MRMLGAILAIIGGLIGLMGYGTFMSLGSTAEQVGTDPAVSGALMGFGALGAGLFVLIILLGAMAFFTTGRGAGVLLMIISFFGIFIGAFFFVIIPFIGGLLVLAGSGSRVTMGSNYT